MNAQKPPWEADDAFPLKPDGSEYGYKFFSKLVPCSIVDLTDWFKAGIVIRPKLVWTPESPRLITPAESRILWPAVRAITIRRYIGVLVVGLLLSLLFGFAVISPHWRPRGFRSLSAEMFLLLGLTPSVWAFFRLKGLRNAVEGDPIHVGRHSRFFAWMRSHKPVMTWVILGCLAATGAAQLIVGDSRAFGAAAFDRPMIQMGEVWRLATGSFLHNSWAHFLDNFLTIAILAWLVENLTGRFSLPLLVLVSLLASGTGTLAFASFDSSIGASDVLFGLFGFLLVQSLLWRHLFPLGMWKLFLFLFAFFLLGELRELEEANQIAHGAGFLVGVVLAFLFPMAKQDRALRTWGLGAAALVIVTAATTVSLAALGRPGISEMYERAMEAQDYEFHGRAADLFTRMLQLKADYAPAYLGRAASRWNMDELDLARKDYDAVLVLTPEDEYAWKWRGTLRGEMGDLAGGLEDLDKSLALNPRTEDAHLFRGWIRVLRQELDLAMIDVESELAMDRKNPYAINLRGRIKALRGDLHGAIADHSLAIPRMSDPDAFIARGDAKQAVGDLRGALEDYESALEIEKDPEALLGKGLVLLKMDDKHRAKGEIEEALKAAHRWWRRRAEADDALRGLQ